MSMNKKRLQAERRRDPSPMMLLVIEPGGLLANLRDTEYLDVFFGLKIPKVASSVPPRSRRRS